MSLLSPALRRESLAQTMTEQNYGLECPRSLALDDDIFDVWCVGLDPSPRSFIGLTPSLTPSDRERARCLSHEQQSRRWIVSRAWLRVMLAAYLAIEPRSVTLARSSLGKPYLIDNDQRLEFSLSRSDDLAVYAFAFQRQIGIDITDAKLVPNADNLADYMLSPAEAEYFFSLSRGESNTMLLRSWTRKEAILKATGWGLNVPPNRVEMCLGPATLLQTSFPDQTGGMSCWKVLDFELSGDRMGAIAVQIV